MTASYETRIRRVRQYIFDNPDGDLSLDALADVAAMSRFHWHRVFHGMTGETCAQAVRRIRAHRAACWLVQTDWPLETIAARAGYDNAQSFARTFKAQFAMTPAAFRKAGRPDPLDPDFIKGDPAMYPVEIRPARRADPHRRPAAQRPLHRDRGQLRAGQHRVHGARALAAGAGHDRSLLRRPGFWCPRRTCGPTPG
ncbi:AraC family transcriptional regulator [Ponticoccus litoralis]|uniref:AraC family transcriptional regulator n=1 Tax=Ponticoccus litoralis TaxID=422297 RepID=A0AAW9SAG9_9RHOB